MLLTDNIVRIAWWSTTVILFDILWVCEQAHKLINRQLIGRELDARDMTTAARFILDQIGTAHDQDGNELDVASSTSPRISIPRTSIASTDVSVASCTIKKSHVGPGQAWTRTRSIFSMIIAFGANVIWILSVIVGSATQLIESYNGV